MNARIGPIRFDFTFPHDLFVRSLPRNSASLILFFSYWFFIACGGLVIFWQVKVWLGDNADHYYVLSRFLLSRMLTVTKVQVRPVKRLSWHRAYQQLFRFIDVFFGYCFLYFVSCQASSMSLSRSLSSLLRVKFIVFLLSSLCLGSKGNVGLFYTGWLTWFESSFVC